AIRLRRAVELAAVTEHHEAGLAGPRRMAGKQLLGAGNARAEQRFALGDVAFGEEFVVDERVADGAMEDFNVGEPLGEFFVLTAARAQLLGEAGELIEPRLQLGAIGLGHLDARRRNRTYLA